MRRLLPLLRKQSTIDAFSTEELIVDCPSCNTHLEHDAPAQTWRVCPSCGSHLPISARARIAALVDAGSFKELDRDLASTDPLAFVDERAYTSRLSETRERYQQADSLISGAAQIDGHPVVLAVLDFRFLGGSMGVVAGEKVARAADLAMKQRWPLITIVASGGARMQEGIFSLLQMAKTAAAMQSMRAAGVPHLSILTHPTTGGVLASFANLGDIIIAEPGALIGFAGPRVVEQLLKQPLPPGSHSAEFLLAHGQIDAIVPRPQHQQYIGQMLAILNPPSVDATETPDLLMPTPEPSPLSAWELVQEARDPARPTSLDYIDRLFKPFTELHGDRDRADDPAVIAGIGLLAGRPVVVIGFERGHGATSDYRRQGRPMPEGYRKAQRLLRFAGRMGYPVLTLIDTPGAWPGIESEEHGLAGEIAETLALMSYLPTPTIAAIIGEGGSGGALALAAADRVLMQERTIYSVIAPEGAAAILYRDASRAPELASKMRITAHDLAALGIVDVVVPEPAGGAASDPAAAAGLLQAAILVELDALAKRRVSKIVRDRQQRYRTIGSDRVTQPKQRVRKRKESATNGLHEKE